MEDDLLAYGVKRTRELNLFGTGDAAKFGAGTMATPAGRAPTTSWWPAASSSRWRIGSRPTRLQFVKDLKVMP